jgi:hypothetical protein
MNTKLPQSPSRVLQKGKIFNRKVHKVSRKGHKGHNFNTLIFAYFARNFAIFAVK